jgi:hypothetical protein
MKGNAYILIWKDYPIRMYVHDSSLQSKHTFYESLYY